MKKGIFVIIFLITTSFQTKVSEYHTWQPNKNLTWDLFKGHPNYEDTIIEALTTTGIYYYHTCTNNELKFEFVAFLDTHGSWCKPIAKTSNILKHESVHFDITGLYMLLLKKHFYETIYLCDDKEAAYAKINMVLNDWRNMQHQYDYETKNSVDIVMQKMWNSNVSIQINNILVYNQITN